MLYSEIIAVCSQIHTKPTNTLCGQNVEIMNVKPNYSKAINRPQRINVKSEVPMAVAVNFMSFCYSRLID